MTDTASEPGQLAASADPFVTQVAWLVSAVGGKDQLAQRSGGLVSVRTLDNWTAGNYPRTKVTGAVRDLDTWARAQMPGYPDAAGVPALVDSCGPNHRPPEAAPPPVSTGEAPTSASEKGRRPIWALAAAA